MAKKLSGLSQPGKLIRKRQEDIIMTDEMRAQLEALKDIEPDLTDPENPEFIFSSNAVRGKFYRPRKQQVTLRLDMPVVEWFKQNAKQYQTLINQACIEYMMRHRKPKRSARTSKR